MSERTTVYVLQSLEDGLLELDGVFTDLERAKHHLEDRYPFLKEWVENRIEQVDGGHVIRWDSHTGKHPVIIEKTFLDTRPHGVEDDE